MSGPIGDDQPLTVGQFVPSFLVEKMAAQITVSRELLGYDDRTPEQREADRIRWHAEKVEAWRLYDAARPALTAITDPLARAILDLHHADTIEFPECRGCEFGGYDAEAPGWPCATVRLVAERFEIALPDNHWLYRRPEETA